MTIRQLLGDQAVHLLTPRMTVTEAARFLAQHRIGGAPVVEGDALVGFLSERDLVFRCVAEERDAQQTLVSDVMTVNVVTAKLDDSVQECKERLQKAHCRHIPVMDGARVVGCLSLRDFLRIELKECELEVEHLKNYIQGSS